MFIRSKRFFLTKNKNSSMFNDLYTMTKISKYLTLLNQNTIHTDDMFDLLFILQKKNRLTQIM